MWSSHIFFGPIYSRPFDECEDKVEKKMERRMEMIHITKWKCQDRNEFINGWHISFIIGFTLQAQKKKRVSFVRTSSYNVRMHKRATNNEYRVEYTYYYMHQMNEIECKWVHKTHTHSL